MPDTNATDVIWDVLDRRAVENLVSGNPPEQILSTLVGTEPSPEDQAQSLIDLAIKGNIKQLKAETDAFKAWAEWHGLRRMSNALIELERVLDLPQRGQAILQAQALTRFIAQHLAGDIKTLKRAVSAKD